MTRPLPTRANSARLEFLVQDLGLLRVTSFVKDDPAADLAPYGLQPPQRELAFALGSQDVFTLQIGHSPPDQTNLVHVRLSGYGNVVLVPRPPLAPWLEVSRDTYHQFCDRRLMIFNLDQVDRFAAAADESFAVQRTTNRTWQIVEPYRAPADDLLMLETFAELASLEFLAFEREVATDFAAYGLAPPRRQYRLEQTRPRDEGPIHHVLAQVDFGNPTGHRYYARRSSKTPSSSPSTPSGSPAPPSRFATGGSGTSPPTSSPRSPSARALTSAASSAPAPWSGPWPKDPAARPTPSPSRRPPTASASSAPNAGPPWATPA
ncbi:MAG: DUF4340 domain-containing protein [Verrucomicrobia bacterium]|nr:DUF4340 domain-containing protein [Verrucomicrobiota bacterium]